MVGKPKPAEREKRGYQPRSEHHSRERGGDVLGDVNWDRQERDHQNQPHYLDRYDDAKCRENEYERVEKGDVYPHDRGVFAIVRNRQNLVVNVPFFYTLILVLSALSVVVAIKVVGLILVKIGRAHV